MQCSLLKPFLGKDDGLPAFQNNDSWCALCQLSPLLVWKCRLNSFQNFFWYHLLSLESDPLEQRAISAPDAPLLVGRWGFSVQDSGSPDHFHGISATFNHFLSWVSEKDFIGTRIVKSRSWRVMGPTQAPFSIDEEMEPRAFKLMARAFSSIPGGSQATPARGHFLPAMPCFPLLYVSPVASSLQACSRN